MKLNEHEKNYVTRDLKFAMIIHALRKSRNYLLGRRFVLMSDHSGLRYLFDLPNLNARQARWLPMTCEFEFEIRYIVGEENKVANALRKRVQMNHIKIMSSHGTDLQD